MTVSRFRILVVLWIVAYGWAVSLPLGHYKQPESVLEVLRYSHRGALLPLPPSAAFLFLFAGITSALGLLFFSRIARGVFVVFTLLSVAFTALGGVHVIPAFDGMLGYITILLHGATLAAAFSLPLSELFRVVEEEEIEAEPEAEPEEELVELYEANNAEVVPVISSLLAGAGIDFTTTENPVRFLVRESDLPRAKNVIQEEIVN